MPNLPTTKLPVQRYPMEPHERCVGSIEAICQASTSLAHWISFVKRGCRADCRFSANGMSTILCMESFVCRPKLSGRIHEA